MVVVAGWLAHRVSPVNKPIGHGIGQPNLEGNMDGLPSSQATSCPERATLIRLTNMTVTVLYVGEGILLRGRRAGRQAGWASKVYVCW